MARETFLNLTEALTTGDGMGRTLAAELVLNERLVTGDDQGHALALTRSLTDALAADDQPITSPAYGRQLSEYLIMKDEVAADRRGDNGDGGHKIFERLAMKDSVKIEVMRRG